MGAKRFKSGKTGVFYKKHATRKHGVAYDKSWIIVYKHDGKTVEEVVGWASNGVTQKDAVDLRIKRLSASKSKTDDASISTPVTRQEHKVARRASEAEALRLQEIENRKATVEGFLDKFIEAIKPSDTITGKTSWAEDVRYIKTKIIPAIGTAKMEDVSTANLSDIVDEYRRTAPVAANRLISTLQKYFTVALQKGVVDQSPAANLTKETEEARDKVLTAAEIKALWTYLNTNRSKTTANLIMTLLLTGKRSGECIGMLWSEIQGDTWTIPKSRTKNRKKDVKVYLSPTALRIINKQKNSSDFVFANKKEVALSPKVCGKFLRRSELGFTPHDLRRTAATLLSRRGVDPSFIQMVLGHAPKSVLGQVYDQNDFEDGLRSVWKTLSQEVIKCLT